MVPQRAQQWFHFFNNIIRDIFSPDTVNPHGVLWLCQCRKVLEAEIKLKKKGKHPSMRKIRTNLSILSLPQHSLPLLIPFLPISISLSSSTTVLTHRPPPHFLQILLYMQSHLLHMINFRVSYFIFFLKRSEEPRDFTAWMSNKMNQVGPTTSNFH